MCASKPLLGSAQLHVHNQPLMGTAMQHSGSICTYIYGPYISMAQWPMGQDVQITCTPLIGLYYMMISAAPEYSGALYRYKQLLLKLS